jgi:hypothetical protein
MLGLSHNILPSDVLQPMLQVQRHECAECNPGAALPAAHEPGRSDDWLPPVTTLHHLQVYISRIATLRVLSARSKLIAHVRYSGNCRPSAYAAQSPQGLNMAVTAFVKWSLGSTFEVSLLGVSEMPKPETKLSLDFASLLGRLLAHATWRSQSNMFPASC